MFYDFPNSKYSSIIEREEITIQTNKQTNKKVKPLLGSISSSGNIKTLTLKQRKNSNYMMVKKSSTSVEFMFIFI